VESGERRPDYRAEMTALEMEIIAQQKLLRDAIAQMTKDMITVTRNINNAVDLIN
jgi:hypothetical protein